MKSPQQNSFACSEIRVTLPNFQLPTICKVVSYFKSNQNLESVNLEGCS